MASIDERDAQRLAGCGYDVALVGSALMQASDPLQLAKALLAAGRTPGDEAMWIKICGMTGQESVAASLAARVDAIGFVFAPSVRQLSAEQAAQLAAPARGRVTLVAVTLHPSQGLVDQLMRVFRPDALQTDLCGFREAALAAVSGSAAGGAG